MRSSADEVIVEHERRFKLFGTEVRLLIGPPMDEGLPSAEAMGIQIEFFLRLLHRKLTRFDPRSELCSLNADPAERRSVSSVLAVAVDAALWAARRSNGLVDPTLVDQLEATGYARSRVDQPQVPLREALADAPVARVARSNVASRWSEIEVDVANRIVKRPPGIRIDTGGSGKGLAADLASQRLGGYATFVVDAGGDLRLGGERSVPREVRIDHPLRSEPAHRFPLDHGAVATSGIKTRLWRTRGGFAHHLLDPSTGEPAWTGVIQATSLGPTALDAETRAKMAFLCGPERASEILAEHGGLIVGNDGSVELFGPLAANAPAPSEAVAA